MEERPTLLPMTLPERVLLQAAVGHGHGGSVSRKAERGGCGG